MERADPMALARDHDLAALTRLLLSGVMILTTPLVTSCDSERRAALMDATATREPGPKSWYGANPLEHLPRGVDQLQSVCSHEGDDMIRGLFCREEPATIGSIAELETALYLDAGHLQGVSGLTMAGHSTSLGARSISSINPRLVAVRIEHPLFDEQDHPVAPGSQGPLSVQLEPISLAFSRGEQFLELMVRDRIDHELRFYLLGFRQACNDSDKGCKPGDLLTPEIEQNWLETTLYDEQDLANTVMDCAPCHQTDGPGTAKFLRMQELRTPWTHWFGLTDGGQALFADYMAAKGDEPFAGLEADVLRRSNPVNLNLQAIYGGPNVQPNPFDSQAIENEVRDSAAALGGGQPQDNAIPGDSPTWREGYARSKRGEAITFPYHDVKVTDPAKLAQMTEAYGAYRRGELERSELPDIRDVFPDDPLRLAEMGFTTEPGLSGDAVLLQACSICHNERLDQSLSRARFRSNLRDVSRAEKDLAIARLRLPEDDPQAMPPPRLRTLSAEARRRAIEVLMR